MTQIDIQKHVTHWREGAIEALAASRDMILRDKRTLFGLFFIHLAIEKILKAHVCSQTGELPPRIHNLIRLAEIAGLELDDEQIRVLAALNEFNLEGRYPETWSAPPSVELAQQYLNRSEKVFTWLMSQL